MARWSMNMREYAEKTNQKVKDVKKKMAFKVYSSIVQKTPVDTGRARGNWQISIGSETNEILERENKSGTADSSEIAKLESVEDDTSIYIVNNLPYISALEHGHSEQAPNGMVDLTLAKASDDFHKICNELGIGG